MTKKTKTTPKKKAPKKTSAILKNPVDSDGDSALLDFLVKQAGGTKAVFRAFSAQRFQALSKGLTLGEALDIADSEGWGDVLRAMKLGALRGSPSKGKRRRSKTAETRKAIMGVLSKDRPMTAREVAKAVNGEPRAVARALSGLVKDGAVVRSGSKRDSKYSQS